VTLRSGFLHSHTWAHAQIHQSEVESEASYVAWLEMCTQTTPSATVQEKNASEVNFHARA